jgi:hypothetical protein
MCNICQLTNVWENNEMIFGLDVNIKVKYMCPNVMNDILLR